MNSIFKFLTNGLLFIALVLTLNFSIIAKDTWVKTKSENFTLIGNAKEKDIRAVANKLEQFRYIFASLLPNLSHDSPIPTTVVVFKNEGSFKKYRSVKWSAGFFQPGEDMNYIALPMDGDKENTYQTIFHEYIHFLVNNNLGRSRIPPWFNEGIAEYYDQLEIEDDELVKVGIINQSHLRFLSQTKMIPLKTFFNIDYYSLHQQKSHGASVFYAQSWALMHYLLLNKPETGSAQLGKFLDSILKGTEPETAFKQVFGMDYEEMEKELERYARQRRFPSGIAFRAKKKMIFDRDMKFIEMDDAESNANLGDLLFHMNQLDQAEELLNEALAAEPEQSYANATMGMLKLRQDKASEAKTYLEKAVRSNEPNFRIYYQYANVLSREGRNAGSLMDAFSEETAEKMRAALTKAIQLNPQFPGSYDLMARVSLMTGKNVDEGIGYLQKAISLSPGNQWYMLNLANLYLRKRELDKAIPVVESVYKTADEPQLRSYAQKLLGDLKNIQAQMNSMRNNGSRVEESDGNPPKLGRRTNVTASTDEEPSESEKEFINQGINNSLRKLGVGESRVLGALTSISCKNGTINYAIEANGKKITLVSKDFQSLEMRAYTSSYDIQIGCDTLKSPLFGVFTYKVSDSAKSKIDGELVALEIVPKGFRLLDGK